MDEQDLGWSARSALTQKSSVPDFRGIQNKEVARSNQGGELRKGGVDQGRSSDRCSRPEQTDPAWQHAGSGKMSPVGRALAAIVPEQYQEFAARAILQGLLGDELGREFVVEV